MADVLAFNLWNLRNLRMILFRTVQETQGHASATPHHPPAHFVSLASTRVRLAKDPCGRLRLRTKPCFRRPLPDNLRLLVGVYARIHQALGSHSASHRSTPSKRSHLPSRVSC